MFIPVVACVCQRLTSEGTPLSCFHLILFETEPVIQPGACSFLTGRPASPQDLPVSAGVQGLQVRTTKSSLYVGAGDLNIAPYTYAARS